MSDKNNTMKYDKLFILLFLTVIQVSNAQVQFEPHLLKYPKKYKGELVNQFQITEIERFNYNLPNNAVLLENGYAQYKISNPEEWQDLMYDNVAYEITIIYTKYPLRPEDWRTNYHFLLANRLLALFQIDEQLNNANIKWNILLQTDCHTEPETKQLFHGISILYRPKTSSISQPTPIANIDEPVAIAPQPQKKLEKTAPNLNEDKPEEALEGIKPNLPTEILENLDQQIEQKQKETLLNYFEQTTERKKTPPLTPRYLKEKTNEIEDFIKNYGSPNHTKHIGKILDRQKNLKKSIVVMDWTGSMYGYGGEVMLWHLLNFQKSDLHYFVFFNDGDGKPNYAKIKGETGGIYCKKATEIEQVLDLFKLVMLKGKGGDAPENDVEAIIEGIKQFPDAEEVILIADNFSCVRDIKLANRIKLPVKVILCGYSDLIGANPHYVELAARTKGSIHTTERDIETLQINVLNMGQDVELTNDKNELLLRVREKCNQVRLSTRRSALRYRIKDKIEEPAYMRKVYYSLEHAVAKKDSVYRLSLANQSHLSIPSPVYTLPKLKALDMHHNAISVVPDKVTSLNNLEVLDLSNNAIRRLPAKIDQLKKLSNLNAAKNNLTNLPSKIIDLSKLKVLNLANNRLRKLPKSIKSLTELRELYLNDNRLKTLPKDIGELYWLEQVELQNNQLEKMPERLAGWKNLRYLDLANNRLTYLPSSLKVAKKITYINLSKNQLTRLPIPLAAMKRLLYLDLSHNQLRKITSSLGNLKKVEYLNLSHNQIIKLHYRIFRMVQLRELDLSNNELKRIPVEITALKQLQVLNLSNNPISKKTLIEIKRLLPNTVVKF